MIGEGCEHVWEFTKYKASNFHIYKCLKCGTQHYSYVFPRGIMTDAELKEREAKLDEKEAAAKEERRKTLESLGLSGDL